MPWRPNYTHFRVFSFSGFFKFLAGGRCSPDPPVLGWGGKPPPGPPPLKRSFFTFDRGGQTGPPRSNDFFFGAADDTRAADDRPAGRPARRSAGRTSVRTPAVRLGRTSGRTPAETFNLRYTRSEVHVPVVVNIIVFTFLLATVSDGTLPVQLRSPSSLAFPCDLCYLGL